jgi:hypothetical protein
VISACACTLSATRRNSKSSVSSFAVLDYGRATCAPHVAAQWPFVDDGAENRSVRALRIET